MHKLLYYAASIVSYKLVLWLLLLGTAGYISFRPGYEYTVASYTLTNLATPTQELFYSLANFDGIHYINIAQRGYIDEARFFPMYPLAVHGMARLFRLIAPTTPALIFASLLISFMALAGSFSLLIKLKPAQPWGKLAITILAFPTSFFLVAAYTESLFLFFMLLTMWLTQKKQWYLACLVAALATATRLVGVMVWLGLIMEWLRQQNIGLAIPESLTPSAFKTELSVIASKIFTSIIRYKLLTFWMFFCLTPLFLFMWYNHWAWNDSWYFLHAHQLLGNSRSATHLINPAITAYRYLTILLTVQPTQYEWSVAVLELIFTSIGIIALGWTWYKNLLPWSWLMMCWGVLIIPILSGTLTGMPRYVLICFPLYWLLNQLPQKWWLSYVSASLIINFFLFLLFAHGYYIA